MATTDGYDGAGKVAEALFNLGNGVGSHTTVQAAVALVCPQAAAG
jgi:hypothetical protein